MKTNKGGLTFIVVGSLILISFIVQLVDLVTKINNNVSTYGAMLSISFGRAIVPFVVLVFLIVLSLIITAALAYRAPQLGDNRERDQLSNLEVSSTGMEKSKHQD